MSFHPVRFFAFLWRLLWVIATPVIFVTIFINPFFNIPAKIGLLYIAANVLNIAYYAWRFRNMSYNLPIYSLPSFDRNPVVATILAIVLAPVFSIVIEYRFLKVLKRVLFG